MIVLSHTRVATLASQNYLFTHVVWDYFRLKFANSTCWNEIRSFTGISWRRCCNSPKYVCLCFPIFGSLYTREPFLHSDHLLADELIAYIFFGWRHGYPCFEGLRQGTFSFVVLLRSSVCLKDPHWNTTDDERRRREKKRAKGFQGFLYGTSGGRNSEGSSPGPPGRFFFLKLRRAHTIEKNT